MPVLLGVVFVVMLTVELIPGDAVALMLGEHATPDEVLAGFADLDLDRARGEAGVYGVRRTGHHLTLHRLLVRDAALDADERVLTDFRHKDGSVATVFDAQNAKTVSRHFAWMKQYGIDGAFLQRFVNPAANPLEPNVGIVELPDAMPASAATDPLAVAA